MAFRNKPSELNIDGILVYKIFNLEIERDNYFSLFPEELVHNMCIGILSTEMIQNWNGSLWKDLETFSSGFWIYLRNV